MASHQLYVVKVRMGLSSHTCLWTKSINIMATDKTEAEMLAVPHVFNFLNENKIYHALVKHIKIKDVIVQR